MSERPKVNLIKPEKPVSQMNDAERKSFADLLFDAIATDPTIKR